MKSNRITRYIYLLEIFLTLLNNTQAQLLDFAVTNNNDTLRGIINYDADTAAINLLIPPHQKMETWGIEQIKSFTMNNEVYQRFPISIETFGTTNGINEFMKYSNHKLVAYMFYKVIYKGFLYTFYEYKAKDQQYMYPVDNVMKLCSKQSGFLLVIDRNGNKTSIDFCTCQDAKHNLQKDHHSWNKAFRRLAKEEGIQPYNIGEIRRTTLSDIPEIARILNRDPRQRSFERKGGLATFGAFVGLGSCSLTDVKNDKLHYKAVVSSIGSYMDIHIPANNVWGARFEVALENSVFKNFSLFNLCPSIWFLRFPNEKRTVSAGGGLGYEYNYPLFLNYNSMRKYDHLYDAEKTMYKLLAYRAILKLFRFHLEGILAPNPTKYTMEKFFQFHLSYRLSRNH